MFLPGIEITFMKRPLYFLLVCILPLYGSGQLNCKKTTTTEGTEQTCYHSNGKKSTLIFNSNKDTHWYHLKIYDQTGTEIYSREYGRKWGSSGVELQYYPSGQVKSARYTMQPDGGIQHYDIKTVFKEDGKFDHEEDNSWGNDVLRHVIAPPSPPIAPIKTEPIKQEVKNANECAPVQTQFDFYIINNTSNEIIITSNNILTFAKPVVRKADSGDTVFIESYYAKPGSPSPLNVFKISLKNEPKKGYRFLIKDLGGSQYREQYASVSLRRIRK